MGRMIAVVGMAANPFGAHQAGPDDRLSDRRENYRRRISRRWRAVGPSARRPAIFQFQRRDRGANRSPSN
jgi:hypothetical protein